MVKLNYCLIKENQISEILYTLSHRKNNTLYALCSGEKEKNFYSMININANYKNIIPLTFQQYQKKDTLKESIVLIINIPHNFETLNSIIQKVELQQQTITLFLLEINKKYLNIIAKKIENLQLQQMSYSANKFVGINDKIRDFVDKSYDMNRAGFYAYGEFINYYRANLLKKIFRTELINVDNLARSYGFTSALKVKQGSFLKVQAQKNKKSLKRAEKKQRKLQQALKLARQSMQQQNVQISQQEEVQPKKRKVIKKNKTLKSKVKK